MAEDALNLHDVTLELRLLKIYQLVLPESSIRHHRMVRLLNWMTCKLITLKQILIDDTLLTLV